MESPVWRRAAATDSGLHWWKGAKYGRVPPGPGKAGTAGLRTSRFPAGREQFAWRTMAHAKRETDRIFLAGRRVCEQFCRGPSPGRGRWPGSGSASRGAARTRSAQAAPKPIEIDDLLKLWERQSSKLRTLDVWIYRIDKNPAWNEEIHYEGRARLQETPARLSRLQEDQDHGQCPGEAGPGPRCEGSQETSDDTPGDDHLRRG